MKLTAISITQPLAVAMATLALVIMGLIAHARLPVDLLPAVAVPSVSVSIGYPGANPTDVEALITKPVEDAVAGLPNATHVRSLSVDGQSSVTVEFADGSNVDLAAMDVERAVNSVRGALPTESRPPVVTKFDASQAPVLLITISGDRPQDQLFELADQTIKPRLEAVDGIAQVDVFGGLAPEIDVQVDPLRLQAHRVTLDQVARAVGQGNVDEPSGELEQGAHTSDVRVTGTARTPAELGGLVIAPGDGQPIHVGDVAAVAAVFKTQTVLTRANGHAAVAIEVFKQSNANTVAVADASSGRFRACRGACRPVWPLGPCSTTRRRRASLSPTSTRT